MTDAIEIVHDRWQLLRPDLDVAPILVIGRVTRAGRLIQRQSDELLREFGLGRTDFDVLAALVRHDGPMTPTAVADETLLSAPAVTKRIRLLGQAGLLEKRDNPDDGRGYLVTPTPRGRALLHDVLDVQIAAEGEMVSRLDGDVRAGLVAGLTALLRELEG
ncbi:DNA-binding MarR family transcriptional regulator [Frigoribacterium sp. PhB160]|jgi:DNA-binding MarR family transcriptional regulator|uniref:MarR family winged helix-turn-helix transcriptional regulator n=1 Tax=Frigoribacterium sp. PhB160 TaxID=2485192 RepID=UPI000F46FC87|nr:MarR family transcriptional regulator [Frigoribacterium sp. PhB160]ROS59221.1 DNA-binding MarR family transcriptional regulator [Frigoribacterium sp. PhB160]